jgi:sigma-B regulation protein RsbU (phosphoserine phosphatase)
MTRGIELSGLRSDGSEFPAEISLGYLKAADKLQVFAAIRDVTERKRAEAFLREKEAQLLIAQEIQRRLLPAGPPDLPGWDIAGANYACDYAAGDFFDYLQLPEGRLGIVVGDVSGHGIGPALLAGCAHTLMRLLARNPHDPASMLTAANTYLLDQTDENRYVTMFMGILDPSARTLTYCSAGHHPAYLLDARGQVKQELWGSGLPLAIVAESEYVCAETIPLEPGDLLLIITDGVVEAASPADEVFGVERLLAVARDHLQQDAQGIIEAVYQAVRVFSGGDSLPDDVTLVAVRVLAP